MKNIAPVEDYAVVKKIFTHLGINEIKRERPPPKIQNLYDEYDDYRCNEYIDDEWENYWEKRKNEELSRNFRC